MATKSFISTYAYHPANTANIRVVWFPFFVQPEDYNFARFTNTDMRLFRCDSDYYLTKYNNSGTNKQGSFTGYTSDSDSHLSTANAVSYSKEQGLLSDDVYFNPAWSTFYVRYKLDPIYMYSSSRAFYVDYYNPEVSDSPQFTNCSSVEVYTNQITDDLYIPKFEFSYTESSGGESSGGSTDVSPLIPAILMIPATIIVVCFFSVIYKMFMNRKVRG